MECEGLTTEAQHDNLTNKILDSSHNSRLQQQRGRLFVTVYWPQ